MQMIELLPMLLGIALTPLGFIPPILLLFSPSPRASSGAFALGWLLGVTVAFLVGLLAADWLADQSPGPWLDWLRLLAGLALLLLAQRQWRTPADATPPAWMQALTDARPAAAGKLGLLLTLANPKVTLLALAAGIATASYAAPDRPLPAALLFGLAATLVVATPLLLHLLAGDRILVPLGHVRDWLMRHNGRIAALLFVVFGVMLTMKGLDAVTA